MAVTSHEAYSIAATSTLTTELNSLANATNSAASATAIDNGPGALDLFADLELNLAATTTRSAGAVVSVYMVQALDGTNYDTVNNTTADLVCVFPLDAANTAIRASRRDIPIPPGLIKFFVRNDCGVALAASGNTLKYRTHSIQTV